ncbi:hypothetical protein Tco_0333557 [Tanacetum coccineum]
MIHGNSVLINDYDLRLTPFLHSFSSTSVEPSPLTPNTVRIIPGPAGIVQQAKLLKEKVFILDSEGALMSTQEYMQKVVEDVSEDEDFNSGAWVSTTNYVIANGGTVTGCLGDIDNFLKNGKLKQVGIVKSCSPNVIRDLIVTIKDISSKIPGTIHYKVISEGGYGNDITVGAAMILVNISVFTPKPSMHYLNITKKSVVKVFRKDTVLASGCQAFNLPYYTNKANLFSSKVYPDDAPISSNTKSFINLSSIANLGINEFNVDTMNNYNSTKHNEDFVALEQVEVEAVRTEYGNARLESPTKSPSQSSKGLLFEELIVDEGTSAMKLTRLQ